jgi:NAD(P)-dependent dehydrogenase (short-subunit alcohol dehydrogenase family)
MVENRSSVILIHTPEPAGLGAPLIGGMGPAWAAMEAFNRNLSAEFGSHGIRAVCIRSTGLPETHTIEVVFGLHAKAMGIPQEQFLKFVESMTHRKRFKHPRRSGKRGGLPRLRQSERNDRHRRESYRRNDRRLAIKC